LNLFDLVEGLLRPQAYPDEVSSVELVETHISYVFLTDSHAYKVKKPVDYGFLDFTALEKRRYYCQREVELNRRLSPEVYLGVVEIREQGGQYAVEGPGRTVEYAVKMRRMPKEQAMNALLARGQVSSEDVERLASKIASFHGRAASGPEITRLGGLEATCRNAEENFSQTEKFVGSCLSRDTYDDLVAFSRAFLAVKWGTFLRREAQGRIRDCHGDLHTANIYLETGAGDAQSDGICVLDCIEFNDRFRYSDVAGDLAFLAMDLDWHGRSDLSRKLVESYAEASGDCGVVDLLQFFKVYRACVRGKVASFRLGDPLLPEDNREQALAEAQGYFRLARSYAHQALARPALFVMAGLSGTGKSTVAQELARRWGLAYIASDITRKELAAVTAGETRRHGFGEGIYNAEFSRRTYDSILGQAERQLAAGGSVVLDATFRRAEERVRALAMAERLGAEAFFVECTAPEDQVRQRLEARSAGAGAVSDGRWELFHHQVADWEAVAEVPANRYIRLCTTAPVQDTARQLLHRLYASVL
jgi:aminoglycoside phosphotransferase family enzyme/predicted kinase